ncbi:MAG: Uma2 family endonuclease [Sporichthyaceae bacterium]
MSVEWGLAALDDHVGPWTEQDYLALPPMGRRIELLDGALLVNASPVSLHQRMALRLAVEFERLRPIDLEALLSVDVRVGVDRILVPDVVVVRARQGSVQVWDPEDVLLALEIGSPGSVGMDRAVKPRLYADAGISVYVRVNLAGPTAAVGQLVDGRYVVDEIGSVLRLSEPFAAAIDLPALLNAPRAGT